MDKEDNPDYIPTAEQIASLLEFLPVFERADFVPSRVEFTPGFFPCHVFSDELDAFHKAAYECGFVFSFDWPAWQDEAERYFLHPEHLRETDLQTIRKLITVHMRKERFCEGHLPGMVQCGHMAAILRRLKEIAAPLTAD